MNQKGFTLLRRSAQQGFTLVELLVSLFIFGVLAAAGVALLSFSVRAQASAQDRLDDIAALRRLSAALTGDLAQATPRLSRNGFGDRVPAFAGQEGNDRDEPLLALVRSGWSNGNGAPRASLQKVEYRVVDGRLERVAFAMLDGGEAQPAAVLIEGVRSVRMRYRQEGDWLERWAPTRADALPRAVDMTVTMAGAIEVRQVFVVGSSYR